MAALRSLFFNRSGSSSLLGRTNFTNYRALMIMRWQVSCSGNAVGAWGHHSSYVCQVVLINTVLIQHAFHAE